jgi:hypothetical protein
MIHKKWVKRHVLKSFPFYFISKRDGKVFRFFSILFYFILKSFLAQLYLFIRNKVIFAYNLFRCSRAFRDWNFGSSLIFNSVVLGFLMDF